jgi:preprotein translocase SecE subunit
MAKASARRPSPPVAPRAVGRVNPITFLQETLSELRKAVWPSKEETARLTVIVICLAVAVGIFLGGLDRFFDFSFSQLIFRR